MWLLVVLVLGLGDRWTLMLLGGLVRMISPVGRIFLSAVMGMRLSGLSLMLLTAS